MTLKQHKNNIETATHILSRVLKKREPKVAIMLGTGLGGLAEKVKESVVTPYSDLPGFPKLSVKGHAGLAIAGTLNGVDVVVLNGRKHMYETDDVAPLKTMIRTLKMLGIEKLFLSNAAGSLRPQIKVSELMLITDHINFMGVHPLIGENEDEFGPRFYSMTNAWDENFNKAIKKAAQRRNIDLHEGVYMAFRGPSFETPAEIRMAQHMGADAIGMSTVPECLIARHCGMTVAGISCITNMGAGLSQETLSHEHTLKNAAKGAAAFEQLVAEMVTCL